MRSREEDGSWAIALADTTINAMFVFLVLFVLNSILPTFEKAAKSSDPGVIAGKMCVEITWPSEMDVDIDLWSRGPDNNIIGYSNKNGAILSLLRDDLGKYQDPGPVNMEMVCSNALQKGAYTFNVHYYGVRDTSGEVPVTLTITFPSANAKANKEKVVTRTTLKAPGEETTVIDFAIGEDGNIIKESENSLQQELRSNTGGSDGQ